MAKNKFRARFKELNGDRKVEQLKRIKEKYGGGLVGNDSFG